MRWALGSLVLVFAVSAQAGPQGAAPVLLKGVGVDERLDEPPVLSRAIERAGLRTLSFPAFVRLIARWEGLDGATTAANWRALDARLTLYQRLSVPVLISIENVPARPDQGDAWPAAIRALAGLLRGRVVGYQLDRPPGSPLPDVATYAYVLKLAAVQIRAVDRRALVAQTQIDSANAAWQAELYERDAAPYIDVVPVAPTRGVTLGSGELSQATALQTLVQEKDPTAQMLVAGVRTEGSAELVTRQWLALMLESLGRKGTVVTSATTAEALAVILRAADQLKDVLSGEIVALDERTVSLTFDAGGRNVTAAVPHVLLYNLSNFSTYLAYWSTASSGDVLEVSLTDQNGRQPVLRDAVGRQARPLAFSWDPSLKQLRFKAAAAERPMVVDFHYGATDVFVSRAEVAGTASLSVAEIIVRQQQEQAAQEAVYRTYTAHARMAQHFRPSPTDSFQVVSENRFYFDRGLVEWEELSFAVNGAKWGPDRPSFPLLQAEKVLSLPLDLRLTADYRYRLEGTEQVGSRRCYVVAFDPLDEQRTLYRGRLWIDTETFRRVRLNTIQARTSAPVVSSEEIQSYETVAEVGGQPIDLPVQITTKQIFLIAGRNLLVEKAVTFSGFEIDAPGFAERRRAAHASDHVMYRDTDQGLRYLVKSGEQRVISDRITSSARALAMGTTIDPSFDFPLPIFGINYLNFNFAGSDSQLALLFGGVLALGNIQKPRLGSLPFDASVDFFAIAVPGNDIVVDAAGERRDERVLTIPFSTGVNVGWQFTAFQKLGANYQFRYDLYFRDRSTSEDFVVPSSTATHGAGLAYEYKRRGYSIGATAGTFRRTAWRPWGAPGAVADTDAAYRRFSVTAAKSLHLTTFQTVHLSAGWYGGERLDRFSMYQFGLFDEVRMHGVPAAGIRFPELLLARASYSFNVFDQYRLDVFLDRASGRDPLDRTRRHGLTGTGIAVNFRTPWNTMLRADVGKSFLPAGYAKSGSVVLQLLLLKPL